MKTLLIILLTWAGVARAATRVALVSTCDRRSVENALALAEADLGHGDGLELVERAQIERVLGEQETCELFDGGRAVAVGRLLNVEVFAVVENYIAEHQAVALVVFDAVRGVRLWDAVLPAGNVERIKEHIVFGVRSATQKYWITEHGLKTVCLLSVRNADLPVEKNSVCQSVGLLIERQLLGSDAIGVLERKRLEHVNQERSLPVTSAPGDLFPSLVTLELELARTGSQGGFKGTMSFSDSKGKELGKVVAAAGKDDWAGLAEALVAKVAKFLEVSPAPQPGDRLKEAQRFSQEAEFLAGHLDVWGALYAEESALALESTNLVTRGRLAGRLVEAAKDLLRADRRTGATRSLRMATRALEMATELRQRPPAGDGGDADGFYSGIHGSESALTSYVRQQAIPMERELDEEGRQIVTALKAGLRHLHVNLVAPYAAAHVTDVDTFYGFAHVIGQLQLDLADLCPNSQAWTSDMLKLFDLYLALAEKHTPRWEWQLMNNRIALQLSCQASHQPAAEQAQLLPLLERMEQHIDPMLQIYGRIGRLHLERQLKGLSQEEISRRYEAVKTFIRAKIADPIREDKHFYRLLSYLAAADAIDLFVERSARQREYQSLFEFMLARREIEVMTARHVVQTEVPMFMAYAGYYGGLQGCGGERQTVPRDDYPRLLENCERLIAMAQSPDHRGIGWTFFSWGAGSNEAEFLLARRGLLRLMPDRAPKPILPWSNARLLYDAGAKRIVRSLATDEGIYALGADGSVIKIPLTGAGPNVISVAPPFEPVGELCLNNGKLYIATHSTGVLAFPLNGGEVERLDESTGFVNDGIESFACVGDKLYAGLAGRSIILAYDLKTRQSRVIASGNRKSRHSPLDNQSKPFGVPFMMADPARHRVLFATTLRGVDHGGLWQIDATTDEIKSLIPCDCSVNHVTQPRENHLLFHIGCVHSGMYESVWTPGGVVDVDLATDRATLLAAFDYRNGGPTLEFADPQIRVSPGVREVLLMHQGQLWFRQSRDELGLLSATNKIPDAIPAAPEYSGGCGIWDKLRLLPNGQLAAINPCGIWLLDVPAAPAPTPPVPPAPPVVVNGETTLEIESFKLNNATIEAMPEASGGKVVRFDPVLGHALLTVELPAGRYEFILYGMSTADGTSGTRLQFDYDYTKEGRNTHLICEQKNQITALRQADPVGPVIHEMKSAGPLKLLLTVWRPRICLDRLVIRSVPSP